MKRFVWVLQIALGVFFIAMGVIHFVLPDNLPGPLGWMYDLSPLLQYISGTAEILGGLGLILPAATRVMPILTPLAAIGLALVMVGASVWHGDRGEVRNVITNLVVAAILIFVASYRWRIESRSAEAAEPSA